MLGRVDTGPVSWTEVQYSVQLLACSKCWGELTLDQYRGLRYSTVCSYWIVLNVGES